MERKRKTEKLTICAQEINPLLITKLGFVPNHAGSHTTKSANFPTSTLPTKCAIPCAIAGLTVYLLTYRLTLKLSAPVPSSSPNTPLCTLFLCAVFHVRITTSPHRPIACESELIMLIAPKSCSTSSAAIVSARIRLSANATSSGIFFDRWWHTISMSRCSSSVFRVYGRVGFVLLGSTFACSTTEIMSGAWPPPAPSVWYVWIVRPLMAARVRSTKPDSLSVSVWIRHCTSSSSQTVRHASMAAGVVPQSSWSLSPQAPAITCSRRALGSLSLPLPVMPILTGSVSQAWSIWRM